MLKNAEGRDAPRRCYLDLMTPAELAIRAACLAVEDMPADVRLTDAVVLLGQAKDAVADFVDGIQATRRDAPQEPHEDDQTRVGPSVPCVEPTGSTAEKPTGAVTAAERTEKA